MNISRLINFRVDKTLTLKSAILLTGRCLCSTLIDLLPLPRVRGLLCLYHNIISELVRPGAKIRQAMSRISAAVTASTCLLVSSEEETMP